MFDNFSAILRDGCKVDSDRLIVVGVSGGPDSLCLVQVLHEAGMQVIVAHFNHGLRPEADAEADAVARTAAVLDVPYVVGMADVRLHAKEQKLSLEAAARDLRYRFLFAQARRQGAQAVAVGHNADDQVETVLMHVVRGAGLNGLRGMAYRTVLPAFDSEIPIIRPLLEIGREQIMTYCAAHDLHPHFDASNETLDFLRNRIRHELLPLLETYNARFREALLRSVRTLSDDHALVKDWLDSSWIKCVVEETDAYVALYSDALTEHSPAQQRHLIRRAVQRLSTMQEIDFAVLERGVAFIADSKLRRMDLIGGFAISREGRTLYIGKLDADLPSGVWPQMPQVADDIEVRVPGKTVLAAGWMFGSYICESPAAAMAECLRNQDSFEAWLDGDRLPISLQLRVPEPGDIIAPLGLEGHSQKLSDVFTNAKLPRRARQRWPVLCSHDTVIWIPGFRVSEAFKLTDRARNAVHVAVW